MQAKQKLLSLKKRLLSDPELHQRYDLLEKDMLEEYLTIKKTNLVGILPHHPVTHPHNPNKVSVVGLCC